jgi:hypothetical protein
MCHDIGNNDQEEVLREFLNRAFARTIKRNIHSENLGGRISDTGISKQVETDVSVNEERTVVTVQEETKGFFLDCGCYSVSQEGIGVITDCCGSIVCKNHLIACARCGANLCRRHSYSGLCRKHWFMRIIGLI